MIKGDNHPLSLGEWSGVRLYLSTLPLPFPFIKASTSCWETILTSPGMVCFKALEATANSNAQSIGLPFARP